MSHQASDNATSNDGRDSGSDVQNPGPQHRPETKSDLDRDQSEQYPAGRKHESDKGSGIVNTSPGSREPVINQASESANHPHQVAHGSPSHGGSRSSTPSQASATYGSPHDNPRGSVSGLEGFVQPSTFLRRARASSRAMAQPKQEESVVDREQRLALKGIRAFLKARTTYDVMPLSFRLIVLDTSLLVKRSLAILAQNAIVSAPLWDSKNSTFAGLLTTSDYINVIQYYWQNPQEMARMDQFRLSALPDIERAIGVIPIQTISIHPLKPLYTACRTMLDSRARRIPLIDIDDDTKRPWIVNVLTQYRILKFVAMNSRETQALRKPLRDLNVGTYENIQTATMDTPVINVIHQLVQYSISSVPILSKEGTVINVFEAVDVIALIKGGTYDDLTLSVGEALEKRSSDFPGIYTCSLDDRLESIFETLRKSRVHRFVVIDENNKLKGLLSLSDILSHILLDGEDDD